MIEKPQDDGRVLPPSLHNGGKARAFSLRHLPRAPRNQAFTLVEIILVMAMLAVVFGLSATSLSHFLRGRNQDSEARRFLSLTRYGQSRAVSEGVPMMLWIDQHAGTYGLEQETGYTDGDTKAVNFAVPRELSIAVANGSQPAQAGSKLVAIHFLPDGAVSTTSVTGVSIREGNSPPVWIVQSASKLNYEIQN